MTATIYSTTEGKDVNNTGLSRIMRSELCYCVAGGKEASSTVHIAERDGYKVREDREANMCTGEQ
jgi:hypothetical protein